MTLQEKVLFNQWPRTGKHLIPARFPVWESFFGQENYGLTKDEAERQVDGWQTRRAEKNTLSSMPVLYLHKFEIVSQL